MATVSGRVANFFSVRVDRVARAAGRRHVARFRAAGGRKADKIRGLPVFLLDVVGRSSGQPRPVMLMLIRRDDDLLVCGSNGGNPEAPNWYRNLMAAGEAHVEVGGDRWAVTAREVEGAERDQCWELLVAGYPDFASYQELTDRTLPVAVLERR
ncbi:nitroreductase family deazaflavin-dependent oxidoreductase [Actinospongicola halichondriae]|uniref:nitroreductase family deazaflavin-dependent oxidoreductase n=1 Tax=Actinospongicola halichondriae TaxID=3236844 RepID=UPI003D491E3A